MHLKRGLGLNISRLMWFVYQENDHASQKTSTECGNHVMAMSACSDTNIPSEELWYHHSDVIMGAMASQITSLAFVYSIVYSGEIKENIKAPRHWPVAGEFPAQMASNTENVCWRHHVFLRCGWSWTAWIMILGYILPIVFPVQSYHHLVAHFIIFHQ